MYQHADSVKRLADAYGDLHNLFRTRWDDKWTISIIERHVFRQKTPGGAGPAGSQPLLFFGSMSNEVTLFETGLLFWESGPQPIAVRSSFTKQYREGNPYGVQGEDGITQLTVA
jgi:hypothetical protein